MSNIDDIETKSAKGIKIYAGAILTIMLSKTFLEIYLKHESLKPTYHSKKRN